MPTLIDLHPYDGRERRFRHTDTPRGDGLAAVRQVLGLDEDPRPEGLLYDLSFYSGGIGVMDSLAITLAASPALWATVLAKFSAQTPEATSCHVEWGEDFLWLLDDCDGARSPRAAALDFVNQRRSAFQPACDPGHRIFFEHASTVNHWGVFWGYDTQLSFAGYDQG